MAQLDDSKQLWEVVGGAEKGGLVVRREADTTSQTFPYRLTRGAWVQELERVGDRLHYVRITGDGPDIGWVSLAGKVKGEFKALLEPREGPPPGSTSTTSRTTSGRGTTATRNAPDIAAANSAAVWKSQTSVAFQSGSAYGASQVEGAVRESDVELDFEVVHEQVMVRRSPSTKDAPLGVVKRGGLLRGMVYDVKGEPWLLLAVVTCSELLLADRQAWVLINGRSVGLGELLRETVAGRTPVDSEGASTLLERAARERRLAIATAIGPNALGADSVEDLKKAAITSADEGAEGKLMDLISVAFWGICDIKYDPRLPPKSRVRVLELGDGKLSRFSHHGRHILERFKGGYCMDEVPIKRSVMVENKKFTHDVFVREGFAHLRPHTASYERSYHPGLAAQIIKDLSAQRSGSVHAVVLKLCNRSRGAGICVVTARDLDSVLRKLLLPPSEKELQAWLVERMPKAVGYTFESPFEEACLHWWSNECPVFVVEECCHSEPVPMEQDGHERFDGTLRVAFALHRGSRAHKYEGARTIKPFDIDWLGGYWKLPRMPLGVGESPDPPAFESMHDRVVSSFNSREKRTAEVSKEHLDEVCGVLKPALPQIFQTGSLGLQQIQEQYSRSTLFCSFAIARAAAQLRSKEMPKARGLYNRARDMVQRPESGREAADDVPRLALLSYIDRNVGVCHVMEGDWATAAVCFRAALRSMPANATAHYLLGCYYQEEGLLDEAGLSHLRSVALDPDFKQAYLALGSVQLLQGHYKQAIETSRHCLFRHPDSPVASYTLGQAIYHLFSIEAVAMEGAEELFGEGKSALGTAKQREPRQWSDSDESILQFFHAHAALQATPPKQPARAWKCFGYRP